MDPNSDVTRPADRGAAHPIRKSMPWLLSLLTLAIVLFTAWRVWPIYAAYSERQFFVRTARTFRVGDSFVGRSTRERFMPRLPHSQGMNGPDQNGNRLFLEFYYGRFGWYALVLDFGPVANNLAGQPIGSVRGYRIVPPPLDYPAQTDATRQTVELVGGGRETACAMDFFEVIRNGVDLDGLVYEPIYADPAGSESAKSNK